MKQKMKVVFMGTSSICLPTLRALKDHPQVSLTCVVSMPSRKSGRGMKMAPPPVAQFALDHHIPLVQTPQVNQEVSFIEKMRTKKIDIIIVFAFAQFISQEILNLPPNGCFNIHTSLLPKYRGAAPLQYALLHGDKETGITIQKMVKKMDAGDIAVSRTIPIEREDNGYSLQEKLQDQAPEVVRIFLKHLLEDTLSLTPQDESQATYAPTLSKGDGHLHFVTQTFQEIHNRLRAFKPWPGTFCYLNDKYLKVFEIAPYPSKTLPPGQGAVHKGCLLVGASDQTIHLKRVQLEGKKPCEDHQLINGLRTDIVIS